MRQAVNGWLLVSAILVVLGIGAVVSTRVIPGTTIPDGDDGGLAAVRHRRSSSRSERRRRSRPGCSPRRPSPSTSTPAPPQQALRIVGVGVTLVGLFLVVDLARYRARLDRTPPPAP